ncbi:hypothetical protein KQI76_06865 [Amphibacillus sp. MSJ-3]|uniref:hypothetical protein n=1 Tax=Amphibacillus sp. MSJ-3 TaxID=2841505 RepID=UPI001C0F2298|nr:hypothetical protein [Amphibacillus sp. MSJ-3]MBU5594882.1 hypothetical protein [Amphibacillus sp. MSJ-3]
MIPAQVNVEIDQKQVKQIIEQELQKQIHQNLLFVDINKLSEITCMSIRYLEDEILCDPRVRIHERRKSRKRWWLYEPTIKAIVDITDEW